MRGTQNTEKRHKLISKAYKGFTSLNKVAPLHSTVKQNPCFPLVRSLAGSSMRWVPSIRMDVASSEIPPLLSFGLRIRSC